MKWDVVGTDPASGRVTMVTISAATAEEAAETATGRGFAVSHVLPHQQDRPYPTSLSHPAPPPSTSLPPSAPPTVVPEYIGLQVGGAMLFVFAILYYLGGLVMFFVALERHRNTSDALLAVAALLMGGVLCQALSAGCSALRDIARNSFR